MRLQESPDESKEDAAKRHNGEIGKNPARSRVHTGVYGRVPDQKERSRTTCRCRNGCVQGRFKPASKHKKRFDKLPRRYTRSLCKRTRNTE